MTIEEFEARAATDAYAGWWNARYLATENMLACETIGYLVTLVVLNQLGPPVAACLKCFKSELIRDDSPRLPPGKWPAWEPGPQVFACPACGEGPIWATEPREVEELAGASRPEPPA